MIPSLIETAAVNGDLQQALIATVEHFGAQAGTIHWMESGGLKLASHWNIPPPVVALIGSVPVGKGIAGLAAERLEPVSICNIQTDQSGQVRPGAKGTGMEGSVAVPMLVGGVLRGVLGVAKVEAYDWTEEEKQILLEIGERLSPRAETVG